MKFWIAVAVCALAVIAGPMLFSSYAMSFLIQLFMFAVLACSWNIIGGYAGYAHFGQASFFGVGAYVGTLLTLRLGVHWAAAAVVAAVTGLLMALILGRILLRLKGHYFAIAMFGLTRVFEAIAYGWSSLTEGGTGLYLPPAYDLNPIYYAFAGLALAMVLLTRWIDGSRFGLQLLAIREDETAAEALGIRTTRLKVIAFAMSATAPAAAGALFATYSSFIDPATAFSPMMELTTIAMVLFGGMGTVLGPLLGAALLSVLNDLLWARFQELYLGMVGIAIVAAVLLMPRGIVNMAVKRAWLPPGRAVFRRLALGLIAARRDP